MARLLFLLLLTAAAQARRKGVNVKKKEKVDLDDARLPPLHEVLAELDLMLMSYWREASRRRGSSARGAGVIFLYMATT